MSKSFARSAIYDYLAFAGTKKIPSSEYSPRSYAKSNSISIHPFGGGYLVWLWLRESKPYCYGIVGSMILISYGVIPTLQKFPTFGRVYAAYGGVFIILAVFWGWFVDKKPPDMYDWIGALVCLLGVSIMLWAPRH